MFKYIYLIIFILCALQGINAQFYNGSQMDFGKNRVQYRDQTKVWTKYKFPRYELFVYQGGQKHASYLANMIDPELEQIEQRLEYTMEERIEIIVYNTQSEFRQSNIGLSSENQLGGIYRVVGSKMFVYFDGNHANFKNNLRQGLAAVIYGQMMYGSRWRDMLQGASTDNLPTWFSKGLHQYIAEGWTVETDNKVRGIMLNKKKIGNLRWEDEETAIYIGMAVWKYVEEYYDNNTMINILYTTRSTRNPNSGFLYVTGNDLKAIFNKVRQQYLNFYEKDVEGRSLNYAGQQVELKTKKRRKYYAYQMNPQGNKALYIENFEGQYTVYLHDILKNKRTKVLRKEHKMPRPADMTFPLVKWHPTGNKFFMFTEHKGFVELYIYDVRKLKFKKRQIKGLVKVLDFNFNEDGSRLIMSAVKDGQTDLFLYSYVGSGYKQLTNDPYDDLQPSFMDSTDKVLFVSNRKDDTLRKKSLYRNIDKQFDVFIWEESNKKTLTRVTKTPKLNEQYPVKLRESKAVYYLDERNGIYNLKYALPDSAVDKIDTVVHYRYFYQDSALTDYKGNVLQAQWVPNTTELNLISLEEGQYKFYRYQLDEKAAYKEIRNTSYINKEEYLSTLMTNNPFELDQDYSIVSYDSVSNYEISVIKFTEVDPNEIGVRTDEEGDSLSGEGKENPELKDRTLPERRSYKVNFILEQGDVTINNSFLNASYQKFNPGAPFFRNAGLNGMMLWKLTDLFEDHIIHGGVRIGGNLKDHEILLRYDNLSKKIDHTYLFHKQSQYVNQGESYFKIHSYSGYYGIGIPIDEVFGMKTTVGYRMDQTVTLAANDIDLREPNTMEHNVTLRQEFIFDNIVPIQTNIQKGSRFKIFGEYFRDVQNAQSNMYILGADFRHYFHLHRNLILATRVAGSSSFGDRKLIYYLGGADNWLLPKFDNDIEIDYSQNYYFQTIATPIRGFWQNSRNGNSFVAANAELRWPFVSFFANRVLPSNFLNDLQLVGFLDAGVAWTGVDPYSEENSFNQTTIQNGPITVVLNKQKEPIVYGFGFGGRTTLLGYFIKGDVAWGVDDGLVNKPMFYLSLGKDF